LLKSSPLILAPAGNKDSFLAALAAGADAVYCGLKTFSARMEAKNFSVKELSGLAHLAHDRGTKVYVALNSLIKASDLEPVGKILDELNRSVKPDALIIQDLSLVRLAKDTGYSGELHLSTLANVSFPEALKLIGNINGINRAVIPRELNIDEIKMMAQACPENLELEIFIHGALCYGVSGRCYWSSYLGGKSGLRGRCVQPCRRIYTQDSPFHNPEDSYSKEKREEYSKRFFSCHDLSLDVLVKVLLSVPQIRTWKIEGRKKGPHYVYYTVKAYQMLRDHGNDPQMKKDALSLLEQALGRAGTHYYFLPQRPQNPVNIEEQTGSGFLMGRIKGSKDTPYLNTREELLPGDMLRIGYEDESWHYIHKVTRYVPKKGRLDLKVTSDKEGSRIFIPNNAPVFLTDRREKELEEMLMNLNNELKLLSGEEIPSSDFHVRIPEQLRKTNKVMDVHVSRNISPRPRAGALKRGEGQNKKFSCKEETGVWLSLNAEHKTENLSQSASEIWWWLPPVIWAEHNDEWKDRTDKLVRKGGRNFVLNAPWQIGFFSKPESLNLWAGPFCNIANPLAADMMKSLGFSGVIVSPELGGEDYIKLPAESSLPLGIVISGNFPFCISRIMPPFSSSQSKDDTGMLFTSPKGEQGWVRKYDDDTWVYPNWQIDITEKKDELQKAGYTLFVHLKEPIPEGINLKKRPGLWNWDLGLV